MGERPVGSKPSAHLVPAISRILTRHGIAGAPVEILRIGAVVSLVANLSAIANRILGQLFVSSLYFNERRLGRFCGLSDNVDNAVDGVCAPQGGAGPADHFDPV